MTKVRSRLLLFNRGLVSPLQWLKYRLVVQQRYRNSFDCCRDSSDRCRLEFRIVEMKPVQILGFNYYASGVKKCCETMFRSRYEYRAKTILMLNWFCCPWSVRQ